MTTTREHSDLIISITTLILNLPLGFPISILKKLFQICFQIWSKNLCNLFWLCFMTIVGYTIQWTYKRAKLFSEDREELVSLISLRANLYITSLAVNRCQEFYDCRGIREIVMTYSLLMMSHITCCVQPVTLLKCNIEIFLYSNIWSLNSVLVYCTTVQLYSVRTRNDDNYLQSECELPIYITPQVR